MQNLMCAYVLIFLQCWGGIEGPTWARRELYSTTGQHLSPGSGFLGAAPVCTVGWHTFWVSASNQEPLLRVLRGMLLPGEIESVWFREVVSYLSFAYTSSKQVSLNSGSPQHPPHWKTIRSLLLPSVLPFILKRDAISDLKEVLKILDNRCCPCHP